MDCLLDTGSDVTLLPARLVGHLSIRRGVHKLLAANGTKRRVLGEVTVIAYGGDHQFRITAIISNHIHEVILGIDLLKY